MSVVAAVERELAGLGVEDSALGAGALVLAERLEDPGTASTAVAAIQRELRETLAVLGAAADEGADRMTVYEQSLRAVAS